MDAAAHERFIAEIMQALGAFFGLPVNATSSLLTDLLYSLEAETRILEQFSNHPENQMAVEAVDCLLTVCEKLPKARMLRSYIGRLAGAQDVLIHKRLLVELLELLTAARRKQKAF